MHFNGEESIYLGPDLALRCLKCSAARGVRNFEERSSANESDGKTVAGKVCGRR